MAPVSATLGLLFQLFLFCCLFSGSLHLFFLSFPLSLSLVSLPGHRPLHMALSLCVICCLCPRGLLLHPPEDFRKCLSAAPAHCASTFIPIQVAGIQFRIYGALTLSRQEGTARLMGWAGWDNNRLFDVTSLIGVDLLTD